MTSTIVDRLYEEFVLITDSLDSAEVSLRNTAEEVFRKALLMAAASYFEKKVIEIVKQAVHEGASGDEIVCELISRKALSRQYHTLFDWEKSNANKFFSLFGDGFLGFMKKEVVGNDGMDGAIKAFLELGNDRNRLVHQDFGAFVLEKTAAEIYANYGLGAVFVERLTSCFSKYREKVIAEPNE